jgi:hypothetical protein
MTHVRPLVATALAFAASLLLAGRTSADASPERRLQQAIEQKDLAAAKSALKDLAAKDDEAAAKAILETCGKAASLLDLEDAASDALAAMSSDGARKALFKIAKSDGVEAARYLAVISLGRVDSADAREALVGAIGVKDPIVTSGAIRELKSHPCADGVRRLIEKLPELEKEKKLANVRREVASALRDLTGQQIDDSRDWKNWWASNGEGWQPAKSEQAAGGGSRGAASGGGGGDVVTRMRENHPNDFKTVERLRKDDIVVVKGRSDQVEQVLDQLKLPYTKVADLGEWKPEPSHQVIVLNCNGGGSPPSEEEIKKLQTFVAQGGYCFSSDWALKAVIQRAFPGKISFLRETPSPEFEVKIDPAPGAIQHPYNRDVFPLDPFKRASFSWKIHERSHVVKLGEGVTVLVQSEDLSEHLAGGGGEGGKDGDGSDGGDNKPRGRHGKYGKGNGSGSSSGGDDGDDDNKPRRGKRRGGNGGGQHGPVGEPTPVAVTFRWGDARIPTGGGGAGGDGAKAGSTGVRGSGQGVEIGGAVLHVMSHFRDQKSADGDGFALQQLLLNFVVEKQRASEANRN